jgi:hypothetical protein
VDPLKPRKRRTQSAYMLWMNQEGRQNAKKRYPDMKVTAVASLCGEIWRGMSAAMKKPWELQAEALKSQEVDRYSESVATAPARKKRPPSAYMLWMNKTGRELAKSQYPDLKVTQIASLCGRYWREMEDEEKVCHPSPARPARSPFVEPANSCNHVFLFSRFFFPSFFLLLRRCWRSTSVADTTTARCLCVRVAETLAGRGGRAQGPVPRR